MRSIFLLAASAVLAATLSLPGPASASGQNAFRVSLVVADSCTIHAGERASGAPPKVECPSRQPYRVAAATSAVQASTVAAPRSIREQDRQAPDRISGYVVVF